MLAPQFPSGPTLISNVQALRNILHRIRNKEGVGSPADELVIHRAVQDIDSLADGISQLQKMHRKELAGRDNRIAEMEEALKNRSEHA